MQKSVFSNIPDYRSYALLSYLYPSNMSLVDQCGLLRSQLDSFREQCQSLQTELELYHKLMREQGGGAGGGARPRTDLTVEKIMKLLAEAAAPARPEHP